ncbi:MAG: uracil-DNA glycosylase family 4 [Planctomycetota bacterium]|jgi:uracil-DNA glycosylase family 4
MPPEPDRRDSPGREPARQSTPPPAGDPIATQAQQPLQEAREAPSQLPRDLAPLATNLAELRAGVAACRACKLCETRTNTVFMDGSPNARVMFIGEGPGYQEDVQGVPFVGPPGQLLTDIIQKGMGLRRADVAITNVVKCRPPENRDPSDEEMALCSPWLDRQIDLVAPEIIISLGPNASGHILGVTASMGRLRSQIHDRGPIKIVPTFHPSYLLRAPEMKKESWKDIQLAMRVLGLDLPGKA